MNHLRVTILSTMLLVIIGCDMDLMNSDSKVTEQPLAEIEMPSGFNFSTKQVINFTLKAANNFDKPLDKVMFTVASVSPDGVEAQLFNALTNSAGEYTRSIPVAAYSDRLIVRTDYLGLVNFVQIDVDGTLVHLDYNQLAPELVSLPRAATGLSKTTSVFDFRLLGDYNAQGKPMNLVKPEEPIRQDFLNDVNASIPEGMDVTATHPEYLADGTQTNTQIFQDADVFVTFFHDGTDFKNVLGFYSYPIGDPPVSPDEIDSLTIIFPNASFSGSGGVMKSGNRVNIGNFPAGTEIGFVLLVDGWNREITPGETQYYSNPDFNPEALPDDRQHNVLLYDSIRDITILGFEDRNREVDSDDDFNDILFYITSNPSSAITGEDLATMTYTGDDTDGDGIADPVDSFPLDPERAYVNYYPARNTFGSLAFEDLWPNRGDYDFNDLVVNYYFQEVMNSDNQVIEINSEFVLKAVGASYANGFGFELPISPNQVDSVAGSLITGSVIDLASNGTEVGQDNAVLIVFDNTSNVIQAQNGYYVNTQLDAPYLLPDTVHVDISFTAPVNSADLMLPPYNPFIFIDQVREREVHLAGYSPTTIASESEYFNTGDDASDLSGYYRTANNLPWALDIVEPLAYPIEKETIDQAHIFFIDWAVSAGINYTDWYKDKAGYRVIENIYAP